MSQANNQPTFANLPFHQGFHFKMKCGAGQAHCDAFNHNSLMRHSVSALQVGVDTNGANSIRPIPQRRLALNPRIVRFLLLDFFCMNKQSPLAVGAARLILPILRRAPRFLATFGLVAVSASLGACATRTAYTGTDTHHYAQAPHVNAAPYSSSYVGVDRVYPRNRFERRYDRRSYRRYGAVPYSTYGTTVVSSQSLASNADPLSDYE
ncbi:MAG: hypothetical protein JWL59_4933 [Chthoniobacteraceae bacterium]|nr:hypothetical protein [Chthoniobacteraceae bacterium]